MRLRPVVEPYSSPISPNFCKSGSSNNVSGKSGSYPTRVSYILTAPYILLIKQGGNPRLHAL